MKILLSLFGWVLFASLCAQAADVLTLKTGERKPCKITGMEGDNLVALFQPVPELPPLRITVRKDLTAAIAFGPDLQRDTWLREATKDQIKELQDLWERFAPLLPFAGAPSGPIGLRLGRVLLDSADAASFSEALAIFSRIAENASSLRDKESAEQGKLRALISLGKTNEAVAGAEKLLSTQPGPNLCAEARLTLGGAMEAALARLLSENPRWDEDEAVGKERTRLYHAALNFYLLPALLPEVSPDLALRGLWGALSLHRKCHEQALAAETARDLVLLYPQTAAAMHAAAFLATLPAEIRDHEGALLHQTTVPSEEAPTNRQPLYEEPNPSVSNENTLDPPSVTPKRRKRSRDGIK